jgi:hypothetical protein
MEMDKRSKKEAPILRREKATPYEDLLHTLQVGVPVAIVLFFLLPFIFRLILR